MKRLIHHIFSKNRKKVQTALVSVLIVLAYLYLTGAQTGAPKTKTVYKKVRKQQESQAKDEDVNRDFVNVKVTYYEPSPRYKITSYEKIEPECFGEACELNLQRKPIEVVPQRRPQCIPISRCVTVNIKTRHRYRDVKEFIDSIHQYYPALKIVVLDEFNPNFQETDWAKTVDDSPLITYIQAKPGVGYGRRLAAKVSETPYVLVADDDYVFDKRTNVTKLVDILENTDADIASGTTDDSFPFAGAIRISVEDSKSLLSLYPGIFYSVVPNYRNCYQSDIVKTFFLAKRDSILKAGSWDPERPFYEHEDFFFQMRKSRIKIAYCDDVIVKHVAKTRELANLRSKYFDEMKVKLLEKWKIDDYFSCKVPESYFDRETCEASKRHHFK